MSHLWKKNTLVASPGGESQNATRKQHELFQAERTFTEVRPDTWRRHWHKSINVCPHSFRSSSYLKPRVFRLLPVFTPSKSESTHFLGGPFKSSEQNTIFFTDSKKSALMRKKKKIFFLLSNSTLAAVFA